MCEGMHCIHCLRVGNS